MSALRSRDLRDSTRICESEQQRASFSGIFEVGWVALHSKSTGEREAHCERRAYGRASTLLTDLAYHWPPRGVLMPRALVGDLMERSCASALYLADIALAVLIETELRRSLLVLRGK